ncbi:orotidine-5'-phosphate decarboxylase [Symbioplanes lichenis]|uniref:orotidine-5'-phosphate decarboxylase n=1 Tax=Symbioplanes lichenis TaxID=1629072 RepID=UPI002739F362|nr:orotidine-5'-phosphate decarboxylase [Actinoplanes lichenis]
MDAIERIIVALDFASAAEAEAAVDRIGPAGRAYKIGLELLTSAGPGPAARLAAAGHLVFLDLKLFEIPSSVAGAVRAAGRLGAGMVTVHASGGPGIMRAAVDAAAEFPGLRVLALTVVTSMTAGDLAELGIAATPAEQTVRLARLARRAGCHGLVASPQDAGTLRQEVGPGPLIVVPGVTVPGTTAPAPDHARPGDAAAAVRAGASHVIVGRPVTRAPDPAGVLRRLAASMNSPR